MSVYKFKDVETKWQQKWEETNQYKTDKLSLILELD